jgi:hypothetical protein
LGYGLQNSGSPSQLILNIPFIQNVRSKSLSSHSLLFSSFQPIRASRRHADRPSSLFDHYSQIDPYQDRSRRGTTFCPAPLREPDRWVCSFPVLCPIPHSSPKLFSHIRSPRPPNNPAPSQLLRALPLLYQPTILRISTSSRRAQTLPRALSLLIYFQRRRIRRHRVPAEGPGL